MQHNYVTDKLILYCQVFLKLKQVKSTAEGVVAIEYEPTEIPTITVRYLFPMTESEIRNYIEGSIAEAKFITIIYKQITAVKS